ncbi:hypothetical protein WA556_002632, partial [Blastocystis sp. ATCC 50177/Nand II]
ASLPYSVNRVTGVVTSVQGPVSGTYSVVGVYAHKSAVLEENHCVPRPVTIPLSIWHANCPAAHAYKLVLRLDRLPLLHARFLLHFSESRELFIDSARGS